MEFLKFIYTYARFLSGKTGVQVTIGGNRACTDGRNIYLPLCIKEMPLATAKTVAVGYLAHECAHILFTDTPVMSQLNQANTRIALNILEDVRIELRMMSMLPGTKKSLADLVAWLVQQGRAQLPSAAESLAGTVLLYVLWMLRFKVLGQSAASHHVIDGDFVLKALLPQGGLQQIEAIALRVRDAQSTSDTLVIAHELVEYLNALSVQQPDPSQDGKGEADAMPDPSQDGEGEADAMPDPSQDGKGEADAMPDPSQGGKGVSLGSITEEADIDVDLGQACADLLNDHQAAESEPTSNIILPGENFLPARGDAITQARVQTVTNGLVYRLRSLVEASTLGRRTMVDQGTRLRRDTLHRSMVGDTRLFQRNVRGTAVDTAIELLIDCSWSMADFGRMAVAKDVTTALSLALVQIPGVKLAATAFPWPNDGSWNGVRQLFDFGDSPSQHLGNISSLTSMGSTPLAEVMLRAGLRLMQQDVARRMVVVMTDGEPDCGPGLTKVIKDLDGIVEMYAIGIQTDAVKEYFKHSAVVSELNDLPRVAFSLLQQALLKQAA